MLKKMFKSFKKNLENKTNISSLFNYDSNPSIKTSSTIDEFTDLTKELTESSFQGIMNPNAHKQKEILKEFIKNSLNIIFESRKEKSNNDFTLNTSKDSDDHNNDFDDKSFSPEIDDLFLYNDFYQDKNGLQKLVIEFYLTKKNGLIKIKELVEKWKLTYNFDESNNIKDIQYFNKKTNLLTKNIISYTRLLPLYQFNIANKNNSDYSLHFKFYQNQSKRKGKFLNNPSGNVVVKDSDLFSFKLKIKYYNTKELKNIFENDEDNNDTCLPNKTKTFSLNKTKMKLNGFESFNKISNDNNPINNINHDEKHIKTCNTEINKDIIREMNSDSNDSSFCLVLDTEEDMKKKNYNINLNIKTNNKKAKRKSSFFSNYDETTEDCSPRYSNSKSNVRTSQRSNEDNISLFSSRKSCMKTDNKTINNILKDYFSVKDMLENLDSSIIIKTDKFIKYAKGCD